MKYSPNTDVYYTYNATDGKVSIVDVNSSEDTIVVIEGEFAGLFMEIVDKGQDTSVLTRFTEDERAEILKMFDSLVKENLLQKA